MECWLLVGAGRSEAAARRGAYRAGTLVVRYPQMPGGRIFLQGGYEIVGQPIASGEGDEAGTIVAHQALGRAQPEVALPVLQQAVNEVLAKPLVRPKLAQEGLGRPSGQGYWQRPA
jgi:hypothetical protein